MPDKSHVVLVNVMLVKGIAIPILTARVVFYAVWIIAQQQVVDTGMPEMTVVGARANSLTRTSSAAVLVSRWDASRCTLLHNRGKL